MSTVQLPPVLLAMSTLRITWSILISFSWHQGAQSPNLSRWHNCNRTLTQKIWHGLWVPYNRGWSSTQYKDSLLKVGWPDDHPQKNATFDHGTSDTSVNRGRNPAGVQKHPCDGHGHRWHGECRLEFRSCESPLATVCHVYQVNQGTNVSKHIWCVDYSCFFCLNTPFPSRIDDKSACNFQSTILCRRKAKTSTAAHHPSSSAPPGYTRTAMTFVLQLEFLKVIKG